MQQSLTSSEVCGLLDRVLNTLNTLNKVRTSLQEKESISEVQTIRVNTESRQVSRAEPGVCHQSITPVLTIKLADLVREGNAARARRGQHVRPQRPIKPPTPRVTSRVTLPLREVRTIEVLYKRQRLAS